LIKLISSPSVLRIVLYC